MTEVEVAAPAAAYTGAGLAEFLDTAASKGWFNVNSAKALKTASIKILSVEGGWEDLDLRSLDIDGLFERFRNLKHNEYSDDTMRIYKTRLTQAIRMYVGRLDADPNWKSYGPSARVASTNSNGKKKSTKAVGTVTESEEIADTETVAAPTYSPKVGLMEFPFPLRDNVDVFLRLPRDLTKDEASRLCGFIASLARAEVRAITSGPTDE
jgi:hypothetical protein